MSSDLIKTLKGFKKYKTESILVIVSIIITLVSLIIFIVSSTHEENEIVINEDKKIDKKISKDDFGDQIFVDISGAVNKPGVYKFKRYSRINDALEIVGGLSYNADTYYFYRNFNLAAYIFDQEKIYIPYLWEVESGIFVENSRILNYLTALPQIKDAIVEKEQTKTNINNATIDELDELSGVGTITAQKIIQNRPYSSIEDLENKKIVNKSVFDNIKNQISVN